MKKIIFCGDTVVPFGATVDVSEIKPLFDNAETLVNLEGAILPDEGELKNYKWSDKYSVYSQPAVLDVCKELNVKYASLCNNHILDYKYPIGKTVERLKSEGIASFGLENHDILVSELNGKKLYIITFATCTNDHALKLYNPDKVVEEIKRLKAGEDCYVVVFPHWGVERLAYVEPTDRKHAHRMVDAGADLIVGHHPHIIQQIEEYKGITIIYSLGNFLFPQTYYGEKKLTFDNPKILDEFIVEWDGKNVMLHALHFDAQTNKLSICRNTEDFIVKLDGMTSDADYKMAFKQKVGNIGFYLKSRPFDSNIGERLFFLLRRLFRLVRKTLIILGVHKPK